MTSTPTTAATGAEAIALAAVALLAALERPDLVRKLVLSAGVFHHDGWAPGAIDLDEETTAFFIAYHGEVSPDGPEHFPVLAAKLHRMHSEEPTLTVADLAGVVAEKGNSNAITDAGVAALLAEAGCKGAAYNVRINVSSLDDRAAGEHLVRLIGRFAPVVGSLCAVTHA